MWDKVKKRMIILNVAIYIILGIIIMKISNLIYRYNRMVVWDSQNELYNQFYIEMQNMILLAWLIWGVLIFLSIVLLILETRKKI